MNKHTPGPWENEESEIVADDGSVIAHVNTVDDFPCIGEDNAPEQMALLVAEMAANARLIAAAPELLEACKASLECHDPANPPMGCEELAAQLRAAIEKAEGAQ